MRLVVAIARGRSWLGELIADPTASADSIAKRENCSARKINISRTCGRSSNNNCPDHHVLKKFSDLDLRRGSVKLGVMGSIRRTVRRTVNVIIALALAALGCGGFVYFYFIAAAWKGWTVISAVMGGVGLYWLSAEFLNWLSAEYLNPDQR